VLENKVADYHQYRDHLGSASMETNENGQVISYEEYHPFGTSAYRTAKSNTDLSLKRYRFTNKERDDETGLYYFGVRYYAAWLGRWTSSDPGDFVDGLNMYVYVRNNPVNGVDLEGYETDPPPVDPNGNAFNVKEGSILGRGASGESSKLKNSDTEVTPVRDSYLTYHSPIDGGGWITYTALFSTKTGSFTRYKASDEKLDSDLDEIAAQREFDIDQERFMAIFNAKRSASGEVFLNIAIGSLAVVTLGVGIGFVVETYGAAVVGKEIAQTVVEETFTAITGVELPSVSIKDFKDFKKLADNSFELVVGTMNKKKYLPHTLFGVRNKKTDTYSMFHLTYDGEVAGNMRIAGSKLQTYGFRKPMNAIVEKYPNNISYIKDKYSLISTPISNSQALNTMNYINTKLGGSGSVGKYGFAYNSCSICATSVIRKGAGIKMEKIHGLHPQTLDGFLKETKGWNIIK
jgi:RHS repeat-associated protein